MKSLLFVSVLSLSLFTTACSNMPGHYKIDIRQGNYIDQVRVERLQVGMTKAEVQLLIGTPLVKDSYRPDTWNYIYTMHKSTTTNTFDYNKLIIDFKDNKIVNIDRVAYDNTSK